MGGRGSWGRASRGLFLFWCPSFFCSWLSSCSMFLRVSRDPIRMLLSSGSMDIKRLL